MTCRCVAHRCTNEAMSTGLCDVCQLCLSIGGDCALPAAPIPPPTLLPPEIVQKDQDVTAAIDTAAEEQLGI